MVRPVLLLAAGFTVLCCIGCGCGVQTAAVDQGAMEKKYTQKDYEQAMKDAGRGKELEEQKKLEADRKAAMGDGGR